MYISKSVLLIIGLTLVSIPIIYGILMALCDMIDENNKKKSGKKK